MSASVLSVPMFRASDSAGVPLSSGKVHTYAAGTTSLLPSYTDSTAASKNANPVILDANGEAAIWLASVPYKIEVRDSSDVVQWTMDNVQPDSVLAGQEWSLMSDTPTYVDASTFTVVGDRALTFVVGRRIRAILIGSTVDGTINSSAYITLTTIGVTWDSVGIDNTISAISLGILATVGADSALQAKTSAASALSSNLSAAASAAAAFTSENAAAANSALATAHIADLANPHVVTKSDVALGNVDNTSDATKNAAIATLTNKTLTSAVATADATAALGLTTKQQVVEKTSSTGSAIMPVGTTAQRDGTPSVGYERWNTTIAAMEAWDGSAWSALGGGGSYTWLVKTASYVLFDNDAVLADTSAGAFNLYVPAAGTVGQKVMISDGLEAGSWGTNNVSLVPNGTDTIDGVNANYVLDMNNGWVELVDNGTGWVVRTSFAVSGIGGYDQLEITANVFATTTFTGIPWNNHAVNSGNFTLSGAVLTCAVAGRYRVSFAASMYNATASTNTQGCQLKHSTIGVKNTQYYSHNAATSSYSGLPNSDMIFDFAVGETLEAQIYTGVTINGGSYCLSSGTILTIEKIQ